MLSAIAVEAPTFAEMFDARVDALTPAARRFLEILAICGRPMAADLLCDASGIESERQSLVARAPRVALHPQQRLVAIASRSTTIEFARDSPREWGPEVARRIHALMVQTLVDRRSDDCEALFEHYRGAGDAANASRQAALAGEKAATALAFGRAAFFYRQALTLCPESPTVPAWEEKLADALANAGRPAEAADAYLRAASRAGHPHQVELRRRAAEQSLISGDIDRGLDLMRTVLAGAGISVPRDRRTALLQLLWRRARLRWRGLGYIAAPADRIDTNVLLRIDTCWALTTGLMAVDMLAAWNFSVLHLLMALDAGEPYRIARAMAMESAARGAYPTGTTWTARLDRDSKALAARVGNPHAIALTILADAIVATTRGEWTRASMLAEQASAILREQCIGVSWEAAMATNVVIWSLMYRGQLGDALAKAAGVAGRRPKPWEHVHCHGVVHPKQLRLAGGRPARRRRAVRLGRASPGGRTRAFTVSTTAPGWLASRPRSTAVMRTRRGGSMPRKKGCSGVRC